MGCKRTEEWAERHHGEQAAEPRWQGHGDPPETRVPAGERRNPKSKDFLSCAHDLVDTTLMKGKDILIKVATLHG